MEGIFKDKGIKINGITHLSPKEAFELLNSEVILVDVREEYMIGYKKFDVQQIIYIPYSECTHSLARIPKDKALIIADSYGLRSKEIVIKLINNGYTEVANLNGGIIDWERDGLPLNVNKKEELNGPCPCQLKIKK
jgi:rhodanese-related sulfurtransferase